jgi:hypothetical protein
MQMLVYLGAGIIAVVVLIVLIIRGNRKEHSR